MLYKAILASFSILFSAFSYGQTDSIVSQKTYPCKYIPRVADSIANHNRDWYRTLNRKFTISRVDTSFYLDPIYKQKWYGLTLNEYILENDQFELMHIHSVFTRDEKANLTGEFRIYSSFKEIFFDGSFVDGFFVNGNIYVYDKDEILIRVEHFKNGKYCEDGQL
jgi:hypothetical protein